MPLRTLRRVFRDAHRSEFNPAAVFLRADLTWAEPSGSPPPTGTGFRRVTAGVEDATGKLVYTADVSDDQITYAKIQNISAADKVLARATAGAGDIEEIACTAAGRALIDDVDATTQRATLGLGALAVKATIATADIDAGAVDDTKLRDSAALTVIGRSANSAGDPADIAAGVDGDVLRRSGTVLGFGAIPQASVTSLVSDLGAKEATANKAAANGYASLDGTTRLPAAQLTVLTFARGGTIVKTDGLTAALTTIVWRAPFACTVTNVRGYRVGGTGATVNARRNGTLNHLASALSLTSADTWLDGGAVQNTAYSAGDKLEIMLVTVTGSPTQIGIQVDLTRP